MHDRRLTAGCLILSLLAYLNPFNMAGARGGSVPDCGSAAD